MLKKILRRPALLLLPAALAFALVLSFFSSSPPAVTASASNTNWGLSFQKEGEAPVGNATSEYLSGYNARYLGNTQQKTIYLTFDSIVSIPAGLIRMPVKWFIGWSAIGIAAWNTVLISVGYLFSERLLAMW